MTERPTPDTGTGVPPGTPDNSPRALSWTAQLLAMDVPLSQLTLNGLSDADRVEVQRVAMGIVPTTEADGEVHQNLVTAVAARLAEGHAQPVMDRFASRVWTDIRATTTPGTIEAGEGAAREVSPRAADAPVHVTPVPALAVEAPPEVPADDEGSTRGTAVPPSAPPPLQAVSGTITTTTGSDSDTSPSSDDDRTPWTPATLTRLADSSRVLLGRYEIPAQTNALSLASRVVWNTHDVERMNDELLDHVVRGIAAAVIQDRAMPVVLGLARDIASDLGVGLPLDDASERELTLPLLSASAVDELRARPGVAARTRGERWTPERLNRAAAERRRDLERLPVVERDARVRQARSVVASLIDTRSVHTELGTTAARELLDDLTAVLAARPPETSHSRDTYLRAYEIADDLGIAAARPPLPDPATAGSRSPVPEVVVGYLPGADSLDEQQREAVREWATDFAATVERHGRLGYLPPRVKVTGDHRDVAWVLALLPAAAPVTSAVDDRRGVEVQVEWDLVPEQERTTPSVPPAERVLDFSSTAEEEPKRSAYDDEQWRHATDSAATWFDPRDPVPSHAVKAARGRGPGEVPVTGWVRGEDDELRATSAVTPGEVRLDTVRGVVRYDTRAFQVDGTPVRDLTVRLFLAPTDRATGARHAPGVLDVVRQRALAGVEDVFNQGYRFPHGEQLHVTVEFTDDPADAHHTIWVTRPGTRATQYHWSPDSPPTTLAHEVGHFLGMVDEYVEPVDGVTVFRRRPGFGRVQADHTLMAAGGSTAGGHLKPRHLWLIGKTMSALESPHRPATDPSATLPEPGAPGAAAEFGAPVVPVAADDGPPAEPPADVLPVNALVADALGADPRSTALFPEPAPDTAPPAQPDTVPVVHEPARALLARSAPDYFLRNQALGAITVPDQGVHGSPKVVDALDRLLSNIDDATPEGVDRVRQALDTEFESLLGGGRTFQVRVGKQWVDAHVTAVLVHPADEAEATTTPPGIVMPDVRMVNNVQSGTVTDGSSAGDLMFAGMVSQGVGVYGMAVVRTPRSHPHTYSTTATSLSDQTVLRAGASKEVRLPVRYTVELLDEKGAGFAREEVAGPDVDVTLQIADELTTSVDAVGAAGTPDAPRPVAPADPGWGTRLAHPFSEAVTDFDARRAFEEASARLHPSITKLGADGRTALREFLAPTNIRDQLIPMINGWVLSPDLLAPHGAKAGAVRMRAVLKDAELVAHNDAGRLRSRSQVVTSGGTSASVATGYDARLSVGAGVGMPDPVMFGGVGLTGGPSVRKVVGGSAGYATTQRTGVEIKGDVGTYKITTDIVISAPTGGDVVLPASTYLRLSLTEAAALGLPVPPGTRNSLTEPDSAGTRFQPPYLTSGIAVGNVEVGEFAPAARVLPQVEEALRALPDLADLLPAWGQDLHPRESAIVPDGLAEQLANQRELTTKLSPAALRLKVEDLMGPGVAVRLKRRGRLTKDYVNIVVTAKLGPAAHLGRTERLHVRDYTAAGPKLGSSTTTTKSLTTGVEGRAGFVRRKLVVATVLVQAALRFHSAKTRSNAAGAVVEGSSLSIGSPAAHVFEHDIEFEVRITSFSRLRTRVRWLVPGSPFRRVPSPTLLAATGKPPGTAQDAPLVLEPIKGEVHLWLGEGATSGTDPVRFLPKPARVTTLSSVPDITSLVAPSAAPPNHDWLHVDALAGVPDLQAAVIDAVNRAADGDTSLTTPGTESRHQLDLLLSPSTVKANLRRTMETGVLHGGLLYDRRITDRVAAVGFTARPSAPRLVDTSPSTASENSITGGSYASDLRASTRGIDVIFNAGATIRRNSHNPHGQGGGNVLLRWMPWLRTTLAAEQSIGLVDRNRVTPEQARTALAQWDIVFTVVAESHNANTFYSGEPAREGAEVVVEGGLFTRVAEATAIALGLLPDLEPAVTDIRAVEAPADGLVPSTLQPPRMLVPGRPGALGIALLEPERVPELAASVRDLVEKIGRDRDASSGHPLFPDSVLDDLTANLQRVVDFFSPTSAKALIDSALDGGVPLLLPKSGRFVGKDVYQVVLTARLVEKPRFLRVVNDGVSIEHAVVGIRRKVAGTVRGASWNAMLRVPAAHSLDPEPNRPANSVGVLPTAAVGGGHRTRHSRTTSDDSIRLRGSGGPMALYEVSIEFELSVVRGKRLVARTTTAPQQLLLRKQADLMTIAPRPPAPHHDGAEVRPATEAAAERIARWRDDSVALPGRPSVEALRGVQLLRSTALAALRLAATDQDRSGLDGLLSAHRPSDLAGLTGTDTGALNTLLSALGSEQVQAALPRMARGEVLEVPRLHESSMGPAARARLEVHALLRAPSLEALSNDLFDIDIAAVSTTTSDNVVRSETSEVSVGFGSGVYNHVAENPDGSRDAPRSVNFITNGMDARHVLDVVDAASGGLSAYRQRDPLAIDCTGVVSFDVVYRITADLGDGRIGVYDLTVPRSAELRMPLADAEAVLGKKISGELERAQEALKAATDAWRAAELVADAARHAAQDLVLALAKVDGDIADRRAASDAASAALRERGDAVASARSLVAEAERRLAERVEDVERSRAAVDAGVEAERRARETADDHARRQVDVFRAWDVEIRRRLAVADGRMREIEAAALSVADRASHAVPFQELTLLFADFKVQRAAAERVRRDLAHAEAALGATGTRPEVRQAAAAVEVARAHLAAAEENALTAQRDLDTARDAVREAEELVVRADRTHSALLAEHDDVVTDSTALREQVDAAKAELTQARTAAEESKREWWRAKAVVEREIAAYNDLPATTPLQPVPEEAEPSEETGPEPRTEPEPETAAHQVRLRAEVPPLLATGVTSRRSAFTEHLDGRLVAGADGPGRTALLDVASWQGDVMAVDVPDDPLDRMSLDGEALDAPVPVEVRSDEAMTDAPPLVGTGLVGTGPVELGHREYAAAGLAFPTDAVDEARLRALYEVLSPEIGTPVLVFATVTPDGGYLVRGKRASAEEVAAEVARSSDYRATGPNDAVVLVLGPTGTPEARLSAAEEFGVALRGDGPYRAVLVATDLPAPDVDGRVRLADAVLENVAWASSNDLSALPLHGMNGEERGLSFLADHALDQRLRALINGGTDHSLRSLGVLHPDGRQEEVVAPWVAATEGDRTRPFFVFLKVENGRFVVPTHEGVPVNLKPREMARLIFAHQHSESLTRGPVRRPLVITTQSETGEGETLNRELVEFLLEFGGPREVYHCAGELEATRFWVLAVHHPARFEPEPVSGLDVVRHSVLQRGYVFPGLDVSGSGDGPVLSGLVSGARVEGPWGDGEPLVVGLSTAERYGRVVVGGGSVFGADAVVELDGVAFGRALLGDPGFVGLVGGHRGPVVLVGADAGSRVGIGGFGFDFASALRAAGHFHDVYASTGAAEVVGNVVRAAANTGAGFVLVSVPRAGDVRVEALPGGDGRAIGFVVRSPGDEEVVEDLRAWAMATDPAKLSSVRTELTEVEQHTPWPADKPPTMIFYRTGQDAASAIRPDGFGGDTSLDELAIVLRNDENVRAVAGSDTDRPFLVAALDGPTADLDDFSTGMAEGGYSRTVYRPADRLVLEVDGRLRTTGPGFVAHSTGGATAERVVSHPLVDPVTGVVHGQLFPSKPFDAAWMSATAAQRRLTGTKHYIREFEEGGSPALANRVRVPWADRTIPPWHIAGHSHRTYAVFRLSSGNPHRYGDVVHHDGGTTARAVISSLAFRKAAPDLGNGVSSSFCLIGGSPSATEPAFAFQARQELERQAGKSVPVWTSTDKVDHKPATGQWTVVDGGRFVEALPPGVEHPEPEVLPDEPAPESAVGPEDVRITVLRDRAGKPVGAAFLTGSELDVVLESFRNGVARPARFHVVGHHGPEGFRVPLKSGGEVVLDDEAFGRLLLEVGGFARGDRVSFLFCSVENPAALVEGLRKHGHTGPVETFPTNVRLTRLGEIRVLEAGDDSVSSADSVVLGNTHSEVLDAPVRFAGVVEPFILPPRGRVAAGMAFPVDAADAARVRALYGRIDYAPGETALLVLAPGTGEGGYRVRGEAVEPERLALEVAASPAYHRLTGPLDQVVVVSERAADPGTHRVAAHRFAVALNGGRPYRKVFLAEPPVVGADGRVRLTADDLHEVSPVSSADLSSMPLYDAYDDDLGVSFLRNYADRLRLEVLSRVVTEHFLRSLSVVRPDGREEEVVPPWATAAVEGRARPVFLVLEVGDEGYVVATDDDVVQVLSPAVLAPTLLLHERVRLLVAGPVRRPLVLVSVGDTPRAEAFNRELVEALVELSGPRQTYHHAGGVEFTSNEAMSLGRSARVEPGPVLGLGVVRHSVLDRGYVFPGLDVSGSGDGSVLSGLVSGVRVVGPWGEDRPLVVGLSTAERYGRVVVGGGSVFGADAVVELDGVAFGRALLGDPGFVGLVGGHRGPVVLVGADAGSRVGIGGFGFDFASALRAAGHFHDVYALTGGGAELVGDVVRSVAGAGFVLVSVPRAGDVRVEALPGGPGRAIGFVVRSPGDEEVVEDLRAWALATDPAKLSSVRTRSSERSRPSPWPADKPPTMIFYTAGRDGVSAIRRDGVGWDLVPADLAAVLRDDENVRDVAGSDTARPFLLAALDGPTPDLEDFSAGMAEGGYSREVHRPAGRLMFSADGVLRVTRPGFFTHSTGAVTADRVLSHPIVDPDTGVVCGQVFPSQPFDAVWMSAGMVNRRKAGLDHYSTEVGVPGGNGGSATRHVRVRVPWAGRPKAPWIVDGHGTRAHAVYALVTGSPHRHGDVVRFPGAIAAQIVVGSSVFADASPDLADGVALQLCHVGKVRNDVDASIALQVRRQLELLSGKDVPVWAATGRVLISPRTGQASVVGGGRFVEALPPGAEQPEPEVLPDEPVSEPPAVVGPEDVRITVLRDRAGNSVGAAFLTGPELKVVREAFRNGAARPGRFHVVGHHGPDGFRVPLKSGEVRTLDDETFSRLLTRSGLVGKRARLSFLFCSVENPGSLREELRKRGHTGGVETFSTKVRLTRLGEIRVLEAGDDSVSSADSVVLGNSPSSVIEPPTPTTAEVEAVAGAEPFTLPPRGHAAAGIVFPTDATDAVRARLRYDAIDCEVDGTALLVLAHSTSDGGYRVRGERVNPEELAAEVAASPTYHRLTGPLDQVVLLTERTSDWHTHRTAAYRFAMALNDGRPYRHVLIPQDSPGPDADGRVRLVGEHLVLVSMASSAHLSSTPLRTAHDDDLGVSFLPGYSANRQLQTIMRGATDHFLRSLGVRHLDEDREVTSPWAAAAHGDRARPFFLFLETGNRTYLLATHDDLVLHLTPRVVALLVLADERVRLLMAGPARRPLVVLSVGDPTEAEALNQELVEALLEFSGPRQTYHHAGPIDLTATGALDLGPLDSIKPGPALDLGHVRHTALDLGYVFAEHGGLPTEHGEVVTALLSGARVEGPWGDEDALVVALPGAERHGRVLVGGGSAIAGDAVVEADGAVFGRMLLDDAGFAGVLAAHDGPLVLVGAHTGTRVAIGGFGFDFASVLRAAGDFRDVYAIADGGAEVTSTGVEPESGARFELVSVLRAGDVRVDPLPDRDGRVVAFVVRSPGDDQVVEDLRAWALATTPDKLSAVRAGAADPARPSPWPADKPPTIILYTAGPEGAAEAVRADGLAGNLLPVELGAVLRDAADVRDAAGEDTDRPFLVAAVNGPTPDLDAFALVLSEGGYARAVHRPAGRLLFEADGLLRTTGEWFVRHTTGGIRPTRVVSHPLVDPVTGKVHGQVFPSRPFDAVWLSASLANRRRLGLDHYRRAVDVPDGPGGTRTRDVLVRVPWSDRTPPPWLVLGHGSRLDARYRLSTGDPHRHGDLFDSPGRIAAHVVVGSRVFEDASPDLANGVVLSLCLVGEAPSRTDASFAYLMRQELERLAGEETPVWAATEEVASGMHDGELTVTDGGRFVEALPPGAKQPEPEVLPDVPAPSPAVDPDDVRFTVLTTGEGKRVGVAFLAGREAWIAKTAFRTGAARPGRSHVVGHHGPDGFRIPLKLGGEVVLDDEAFGRLTTALNLFDPTDRLSFLFCSVQDPVPLREALRESGHLGPIETFATKVRLTRSGEVQVLEEGDDSVSSKDSVVLASSAEAVMFSATAGGADRDRWRWLHRLMPPTAGPFPPVHVFAHARAGVLFADGGWHDGEGFAGKLVDAGVADSPPAAPLILALELLRADRAHVPAARAVARVLRGDGPYRDVLVNTAPLRVDPRTGSVDVTAAGFERVSDLLPADVLVQRLDNRRGDPHGAALLASTELYPDLREAALFSNDFTLRIALYAEDVDKPLSTWQAGVLEWASSTDGDRARPFLLHLESDGHSYLVRTSSDQALRVSTPELAGLLAARVFGGGPPGTAVRRPIVLVTRSPEPVGPLNQELLRLLFEKIGVRPSYEYSGPVGLRDEAGGEVVGVFDALVLATGRTFRRGPAVTGADVVVRGLDDRFLLTGADQLPPSLGELVDEVATGRGGTRPWGDREVLVVGARTAERHATVPTRDGGRLELGGSEVGQVLLRDEDFHHALRAHPDRPVVLVGEHAGTRVGIDGFGYDFASALHEAHDFREVFALAGSARDGAFVRVSDLRAGDLVLEPLLNSAGTEVAVVVRSPGDHVEVGRARSWARDATAETMSRFWDVDAGASQDSPWSAGTSPLLILAGRRDDFYRALRSDAAPVGMTLEGLAAVLRDDVRVRTAAGFLPERDFVFAALDGESVEPRGLAEALFPGGYARRVHWPVGRLVLSAGGAIGVLGGGFRTLERVAAEPDDFVTHPLLNVSSGLVEGQFYPSGPSDLAFMSLARWHEETARYKNYFKVTTRHDEGVVVRREEKRRMKWLKSAVPPWFLDAHGLPGVLIARLRAGDPFLFGDRVYLDRTVAGKVLTLNRIYRSAEHPAGQQKVGTVCLLAAPPEGGGPPLAVSLADAFGTADGVPVTVWAATASISVDATNGRRKVHDHGRYLTAVTHSQELHDPSSDDEDSDTDAETGADTGGTRPSTLPPSHVATAAVVFPFGPADEEHWRGLYDRMPKRADGTRPVYVFVYGEDGHYFVDGEWLPGAALAARVAPLLGPLAADPRTPMTLLVDEPFPTAHSLRGAEEFAEALRGDGPYRDVGVNLTPVVTSPTHGHTDVGGASITRVSLVRATDVSWEPLYDAHGHDRGMTLNGDADFRFRARRSARERADHALGTIGAIVDERPAEVTAALWAAATTGNPALPFTLHLDSENGSYDIALRDRRALRLTVRDVRRMLAEHWYYRRLAGGPVRRPLILVARSSVPDSAPNRELLDALAEVDGVRPAEEYSGPVEFAPGSGAPGAGALIEPTPDRPVTPADAHRVPLHDAHGTFVGVAFLTGAEAEVARKAFRATAVEPGRFHVVVHHGPRGFEVPLKTGGRVALDDAAFTRLAMGVGLGDPWGTLTFLSCDVADSERLRALARDAGHRGPVEVFRTGGQLIDTGEIRELSPGVAPARPRTR
ncbi:hypothetical protein ACQPYE_17200 [Actinosynnema sp. CA-299493]